MLAVDGVGVADADAKWSVCFPRHRAAKKTFETKERERVRERERE